MDVLTTFEWTGIGDGVQRISDASFLRLASHFEWVSMECMSPGNSKKEGKYDGRQFMFTAQTISLSPHSQLRSNIPLRAILLENLLDLRRLHRNHLLRHLVPLVLLFA